MANWLDKTFGKYAEWSTLLVRLGVGVVFLTHGVGKLFGVGPFALGITNTSGFFASLGIPAALFFALVVALVETLGGLAVLLGLFTRHAALLLAIDMVVAILVFHIPKGFYASTGELPLLLATGTLALLVGGAGKRWVLERMLLKKEL